ncbi:Rv3654c family TadE-like protein [Streptomyces nogalater]
MAGRAGGGPVRARSRKHQGDGVVGGGRAGGSVPGPGSVGVRHRAGGLVRRRGERCLGGRGAAGGVARRRRAACATVWRGGAGPTGVGHRVEPGGDGLAVRGVRRGAPLRAGRRRTAPGGRGADLAALAAADHWAEGGTAACARAGRLAAGHGARLVRCAIVGDTAEVTAAVRTGPFAAEARASGPAGPAAVRAPRRTRGRAACRAGLAGVGAVRDRRRAWGGAACRAGLAGPAAARAPRRTPDRALCRTGSAGIGPAGIGGARAPDGPRAIPPAEPGPPSAPLTP